MHSTKIPAGNIDARTKIEYKCVNHEIYAPISVNHEIYAPIIVNHEIF